jgi:hypothetical protein
MQFANLCARNHFAVMLSILVVPAAHAAYIMTISQVAANVVTTGSGSIDTDALTAHNTTITAPQVEPNFGALIVGPAGNAFPSITQYSGVSGPTIFGSGDTETPSSGSGSAVGIIGSVSYIYVPQGYTAGTDLGMSTDTYTNQSFSSLGLTPGTYTYTWGAGPTADSLTVNIVVPEPTCLGLLALTSAALLRRRHRTRSADKN